MKLRFTAKASREYERLPLAISKAFGKQLRFLLLNIGHPSLHAKKYNETLDVWQGRVTRDWRFYFTIDGDEYVVLSIIPHPK